MIFYKKPKIYKDGSVRHGVVIIDGVKYTAEFVEPKNHDQNVIRDLTVYEPIANLEKIHDLLGYALINYKGIPLKLTKIE